MNDAPMKATGIVNALSFDIEDWFHMVEVEAVADVSKWDEYDSLVEVLLDKSTIGLDEMKGIFGGKVFKDDPPEDGKSKDDEEDED